jgi:hypothetical protein
MGFFAKSEGAQQTPPASTPPATSSTSPMGFFAKKDESAAPATPPPAETRQPAAEQPPADGDKTKLPKAIQDLIENAAKETKKEIFKDKDDIDAAE